MFTAMERIPLEIVSRILAYAINEANSRCTELLRIMCVCKTWLPVAEALLFERVSLNSSSAITEFQMRLLYDSLPPDAGQPVIGSLKRPVGYLVLHLDIFSTSATEINTTKRDYSETIVPAIASILMHAPSLRSFTNKLPDTKLIHVLSLARTCPRSCTKLDVTIPMYEKGALASLNALSNLQHLSLTFKLHLDSRRRHVIWAHEPSRPLTLAHVTHVEWNALDLPPGIASPMFKFLAACKFGRLDIFEMRLNRTVMGIPDAAVALPFFAHQVTHLVFEGVKRDAQRILAPLMQGRPSLGFLCALPSMELLNQGTLPSSFCIHCFEDIAEPEEYIWQFLEKLETASFELPPAGCELRLVWRRGPSDFSWFGGGRQ